MSLSADIHQRHVNFHAAIARRAALVSVKETPVPIYIPNTAFGVPKIKLPIIREYYRESNYWHLMWCYDLVHSQPQPTPERLTVRKIQVAICHQFGVRMLDLLSCRRTADIVRPRQVGYFLSKKLIGCSLPDIGRRFGGRDHTSALAGIRKIEALRKTDDELNAKIMAVVAELGASLG